MTSTLEQQQEAALKMFYAALGAPVLVGQKAKEFGMALVNETSFKDLETAGRDFANSLQETKVVEQLQETIDVEQFQETVDNVRDQLETLLTSWRDQFDPSVKKSSNVKIEVDDNGGAKKKTTAKKTSSTKKTSTSATAKK
ncbi:MAG: hypothetical protein BMS9Abin07_0760 [Acidimicrobiia bacterium]|nr:MAG: hypothetical protein BMS9Abin07_0760 [Acidimicrobiia bacterium]